MFTVKLKVKEGPRTNSLPRRRRATPSSSFSSSTSSLSRLQNNGVKVPTKSSFLSNKNGKGNKKVRIQTTYEQSSGYNNGRWTDAATDCFSLFFFITFTIRALNYIWHTFGKKWAFWRWLDPRASESWTKHLQCVRACKFHGWRQRRWCHRRMEFLAREVEEDEKHKLMIKNVNKNFRRAYTWLSCYCFTLAVTEKAVGDKNTRNENDGRIRVREAFSGDKMSKDYGKAEFFIGIRQTTKGEDIIGSILVKMTFLRWQ